MYGERYILQKEYTNEGLCRRIMINRIEREYVASFLEDVNYLH